jgi:hypothetical protein
MLVMDRTERQCVACTIKSVVYDSRIDLIEDFRARNKARHM